MNRLLPAVAGASWLTAALIFAGGASAAPADEYEDYEDADAAAVVEELRSQGFGVQVHGARNGPLTECDVEGVSSDKSGTKIVDVTCTPDYTG